MGTALLQPNVVAIVEVVLSAYIIVVTFDQIHTFSSLKFVNTIRYNHLK